MLIRVCWFMDVNAVPSAGFLTMWAGFLIAQKYSKSSLLNLNQDVEKTLHNNNVIKKVIQILFWTQNPSLTLYLTLESSSNPKVYFLNRWKLKKVYLERTLKKVWKTNFSLLQKFWFMDQKANTQTQSNLQRTDFLRHFLLNMALGIWCNFWFLFFVLLSAVFRFLELS